MSRGPQPTQPVAGPCRGRGPSRGVASVLGALLAWLAPVHGSPQERGAERDTVPPARPDSVAVEVGELEVEAVRPVLTGGGATAVRMEMDSVETAPSPTLAEVMRNMPLLRVRQNSRGQIQPSLRGMEERQITILVDQVPLTVGWDNRSDLSVIPMTAVSEVHMVRGLSSVLAGPNALGAIVEIGISHGGIPADVREGPDVRASVDQEGAIALSGRVDHLLDAGGGSLWIKYGGGYRERDGFAAPGGLDPAGVVDGRVVNSQMELANGFVAARYESDGGGWLSLSSAGYWTEQGVVPELHLLGGAEPEPRFWRYPNRWQSFTSLSAGTGRTGTPLGRGRLELSLGLDLRHQEIDSFDGLAFADSVEGETGDDRTISVRLVGDHQLGPGSASAAFTWAETWHEQTLSSAPRDPEEFEQRLWSAGLEVTQPIVPGDDEGWLSDPRVTVGGSYDASSTPRTGDAPARPGIDGWGFRAGSRVDVAHGMGTLHGGVSRKVRFPALRELFSGALGKFKPNPDLGPLTLKVGEVGATLRPAPGLEVQGTLFQQRLEGSIVRAVLPDGRFQRQNRGETRATGVELAANWRTGGVSLRGDLTLQEVELLDDEGEPVEGERAEYQPEVAANLNVTAPVGLGVRARGELAFLGTQFGANPETGRFEEVDPNVYLEAGLSRTLGEGVAGLPRLRVALVAENLTDDVLLDQLGLPRPGRTVRVQVEVR